MFGFYLFNILVNVINCKKLFRHSWPVCVLRRLAWKGYCVLWPLFRCCAFTRKLVEIFFFSRFQPYLFISNLISPKSMWKWTCFFHILLTPQCWSTCKSWSNPWGGTPKLSFFGWFLILMLFRSNAINVIFLTCTMFHCVDNNHKKIKTEQIKNRL